MRYDRIVIGYHGCDAQTARRLLDGEPFKPSENDYDWLGRGVYFWEFGPDRAYRFAEFQQSRGKIRTPAVVGRSSSSETASTCWTRASRRSCGRLIRRGKK